MSYDEVFYWLRYNVPQAKWRRATVEEFVKAERAAGFFGYDGFYDDKPSTAGFHSSTSNVEGTVTYSDVPPKERD